MNQTLGKYQIEELLGSGATADVYRARDTQLGRIVALKVLKPALVADAAAFARFIQEAQAAAALFHPSIATVLEMDEVDGRFFIAMRYISGQSLDKILHANGPLTWDETVKLATQIAAALDFAHSEGFLHRDVKPSNIIRTANGEFYVLTDFGLTRAMMRTGLTSHTGAVLGTPAYIAPEIWDGQEASLASDQYSLACVVYEALTGQVLFGGNTPIAILTNHVKGAVLPSSWPEGVPDGINDVLARALSKESAARFESASALATALKALEQNKPTQKPVLESLEQPSLEKEPVVSKLVEPLKDQHSITSPTIHEPKLANEERVEKQPPSTLKNGDTFANHQKVDHQSQPINGLSGITPSQGKPRLNTSRNLLVIGGCVGLFVMAICVIVGVIVFPNLIGRGKVATIPTSAPTMTEFLVESTKTSEPLKATVRNIEPTTQPQESTKTPEPLKATATSVSNVKKIKIGISMSDFYTERWKPEADLMKMLLEEKGYEVIVQEANHDVQLQNDQIDNMVLQGIKGLIVVAEDGDAAAIAVDKAAAAGVKVISYDRLIRTDKIAAYLSFDFVEVGRQQAEGVMKAVGIDTWDVVANGKLRLVKLGGFPTDNGAILFRKGQDEVLAKYADKIEVIADQWVDNWDPANAVKLMENILIAAGNDIDAVVTSNDGTALGALQAMQAQGLAGKVPISGQDATADGCNSIVKGELTVTIFKDIRNLAPIAVDLMDKLIKGTNIPELKTFTVAELTNDSSKTGNIQAYFLPMVQVTKDNVFDEIVKSGFQAYDDVYRDIPADQRPPKP